MLTQRLFRKAGPFQVVQKFDQERTDLAGEGVRFVVPVPVLDHRFYLVVVHRHLFAQGCQFRQVYRVPVCNLLVGMNVGEVKDGFSGTQGYALTAQMLCNEIGKGSQCRSEQRDLLLARWMILPGGMFFIISG